MITICIPKQYFFNSLFLVQNTAYKCFNKVKKKNDQSHSRHTTVNTIIVFGNKTSTSAVLLHVQTGTGYYGARAMYFLVIIIIACTMYILKY